MWERLQISARSLHLSHLTKQDSIDFCKIIERPLRFYSLNIRFVKFEVFLCAIDEKKMRILATLAAIATANQVHINKMNSEPMSGKPQGLGVGLGLAKMTS